LLQRSAQFIQQLRILDGGRTQLLPRFVEFVGKPRELCFLAGGG
jgi:hypothetical protein